MRTAQVPTETVSIWSINGVDGHPKLQIRRPSFVIRKGAKDGIPTNQPGGLVSPLSVRRRNLSRRDLVLEVVRIETVDPPVACFGLRIHKEADRRAG
jgi:hypothetical protein